MMTTTAKYRQQQEARPVAQFGRRGAPQPEREGNPRTQRQKRAPGAAFAAVRAGRQGQIPLPGQRLLAVRAEGLPGAARREERIGQVVDQRGGGIPIIPAKIKSI